MPIGIQESFWDSVYINIYIFYAIKDFVVFFAQKLHRASSLKPEVVIVNDMRPIAKTKYNSMFLMVCCALLLLRCAIKIMAKP